MIRLEMAAVMDGGSIFRNKTYFLEGGGALIFVAYDTIMSLFAFIDNPRWENVDAVIEGLVANLPNPGSERECLKAHTLTNSVVQPGFSYFHQKFTIDLAHEMQLLKYARLCNPVRIREIRPTPQQLDDLNIFKCISVPQPLVCLSGLKSELPIFLALAQGLHAEDFQMNDSLPFFLCSPK